MNLTTDDLLRAYRGMKTIREFEERVQKDPTLIYSAVGHVQDMREVVEMAAAGQIKSHIGRVGKLSELGAVFDELEAGKYVGRAVITDLGS